MTDQRCIGHPDTIAVTACRTCRRPLCAACAAGPGGPVCSPDCARPRERAGTGRRVRSGDHGTHRREPARGPAPAPVAVPAAIAAVVLAAAGAILAAVAFDRPASPVAVPAPLPSAPAAADLVPDPVPAPEPLPVPAPLARRLLDPWASEKPGAWYRVRRTRGALVTYLDTGLLARNAAGPTIVTQAFTDARGLEESRVEAVDLPIARTEAVTVESLDYPCDVLETGDAFRWIVREGDRAGLPLQIRTPLETRRVLRFHPPEKLEIRGRTFNAIALEEASTGKGGPCRSWFSSDCPLGIVKLERGAEAEELTDFGDDWQRREFPPERARAEAQELLARASRRVVEARPLCAETQDALRSLPSDQLALKALREKASRAQTLLREARREFLRARPDSPAPPDVDRRVADIDALLDGLDHALRVLPELCR